MQEPILEILTWKSSLDVTDNDMVKAMEVFSERVAALPGFLYQSLHKKDKLGWLCLYLWETEQHAHDSNTLVADFPEFNHLVSLIQPESITIEILPSKQSQGVLHIT